jgi:hypothetical protein
MGQWPRRRGCGGHNGFGGRKCSPNWVARRGGRGFCRGWARRRRCSGALCGRSCTGASGWRVNLGLRSSGSLKHDLGRCVAHFRSRRSRGMLRCGLGCGPGVPRSRRRFRPLSRCGLVARASGPAGFWFCRLDHSSSWNLKMRVFCLPAYGARHRLSISVQGAPMCVMARRAAQRS